jgi:hypothetical protein
MTKKWEYLMHSSTRLKNVKGDLISHIINDGFLKNPIQKFTFTFKEIKKNPKLLEYNSAPFLYTQYIYSEIPLKSEQYWTFIQGIWPKLFLDYAIVFMIDIKALQDFEFYSCKGTNFGECIFTKDKDSLIQHSSGNLKRKPNLSKLKNYIENELTIKHSMDKYSNSHEILFESIPVSFIKAIASNFTPKQTKIYTELFKKHKLDIKLVPLSTNFHDVFDNI